jgi:quaternary ammonium compound-resistance protein SugE
VESLARVTLAPLTVRGQHAKGLGNRMGLKMAWVYLVIAGIFEWGWPVGLKLGLADTGLRWGWIGFAGVCMAASGALLLIAQKTIPMGTAYAVWTGIGAVGTFVLGIFLFGESAAFVRFFFVGLIIVGIVGLKLASPH